MSAPASSRTESRPVLSYAGNRNALLIVSRVMRRLLRQGSGAEALVKLYMKDRNINHVDQEWSRGEGRCDLSLSREPLENLPQGCREALQEVRDIIESMSQEGSAGHAHRQIRLAVRSGIVTVKETWGKSQHKTI